MSILIDPREGTSGDLADGWNRRVTGLIVPQRGRRWYDRPVAVDLFSGAGGFGLGFHQAGFHVAAASEMVMEAALTYMCNLARPGVRIHFDTAEREAEWERRLAASYGLDPKGKGIKATDRLVGADGHILAAGTGWIAGQPHSHPGCEHFFVYDVRKLTGPIVLEALDLEPGEVDCIFGGPPCQGFSTAGKRNVMDPRNSLVFEFARLVCEIKPKTFVMENVPGMLAMTTPEGMPVIDAFCYAAASGGYADYEALRSALGAAGGKARAGVKGRPAKKAAKPKAAPVVDGILAVEPGQDALFDLGGG